MSFNCKPFNQRVANLWKKYQEDKEWGEHVKLAPCMVGDLYQNSFLFIGFNASQTGMKKAIKAKSAKEEDVYFKDVKPEDLIQEEADKEMKNAKKESTYHKANQRFFDELQSGDLQINTKTTWSYLDLFYPIHTDQLDIKNKYITGDKLKSGFPQEQFEITIDLIKKLNPLAIVVVNAAASRILKANEEIKGGGVKYYYFSENKTPIFFSGMLSGQGIIDTYSRERLIWDIKRVLNSI